MNNNYITLDINIYDCDSIGKMWEDEIDVAFEELEQMIFELDLSDETIQKLYGVLQKDKANLLYDLMFDVIDKNDELEPMFVCNLFECPICQTNVSMDNKYCHECGQKLDWSNK